MFIYFYIVYFLFLNYIVFKKNEDYFFPFHLASFALFYYTIGPLLFNEYISLEFSSSIVFNYEIVVIIALTGLFIGFQIKPFRSNIYFKNEYKHKAPLLIVMFVSFLLVFPNLLAYFSVSSDYSNALENRLNRTALSPILDYLLVYFLFSIQFYVLLNIKNNKLRFVIIFVLFLPSILSGSRVLFIGTLFVLASIFRSQINSIKPIKLLISFLFFVLFFSFLGTIRGQQLNLNEIVNLFNVIYENNGLLGFLFSGEFVNPGNSLFLVLKEYHRDGDFFLLGATYINDLISIIPNFLFEHPVTSIDFFHIKFHLDEFKLGKGYGFSPITEAFWNFGFIGVLFILVFLGYLLKLAYFFFINCKSKLLYYSYFSVFFYLNFTVFRGSIILVFKNFILHIIVFVFIELLFNKIFIKNVKKNY